MITLTPTDDQIKYAKDLSASLGNIKNSVMKGSRNYSGFIGEKVIADLLDCEHKSTKDYDLVLKDGTTVDCKTYTSKYKPKETYMCNIMEASLHQRCDAYVFTNFNPEQNLVYVCGYIPKKDFFEKADYVKKGDKSPVNGVQYKSNGYNLAIKELYPIEDLL